MPACRTSHGSMGEETPPNNLSHESADRQMHRHTDVTDNITFSANAGGNSRKWHKHVRAAQTWSAHTFTICKIQYLKGSDWKMTGLCPPVGLKGSHDAIHPKV